LVNFGCVGKKSQLSFLKSPTIVEERKMTTPYQITINMDPDTISKLKTSGFQLFGFKAVQSSVKGAVPLIWFSSTTYQIDTIVTWTEDYQAYVSSQVTPAQGTVITSSSFQNISLGQIMSVDNVGNTSLSPGGQADAISITAVQGQQWTAGISQTVNGQTSPLCAVPLFGGNLDTFIPIEKVLLMFATSPYQSGTVIVQAFGPGVLIDLTGGQNRIVTYDINNGWNSDAPQTWATNVPVNASLTPLLIES
jgi:hypothetical protein